MNGDIHKMSDTLIHGFSLSGNDDELRIRIWSAIIAMLVAFLTIRFQAIKSATSNPVNALRSE